MGGKTPDAPDASEPAATAAPATAAPPEATAEPTPPAATTEPPAGPVVAEYISESPRTYRFPGAPLTVHQGDICALPYLPDDGNWQPSQGIITRLPDNHEDNQPQTPNPEDVAHSLADHEAILARLGADQPKEA